VSRVMCSIARLFFVKQKLIMVADPVLEHFGVEPVEV
jgi:hypothetical protein